MPRRSPSQDDSFDLVVCQFGIMFMPDKVRANSEARRVLRDGGRYMLVIWDRIDHNLATMAVGRAVGDLFPDDPPRFYERIPFGYHDLARIEQDLLAAGFTDIEFETIELRSRAASARDAAIGLCPGHAGAQRDRADAIRRMLGSATDAAAEALRQYEGPDGFDAPMSAHLVTAIK